MWKLKINKVYKTGEVNTCKLNWRTVNNKYISLWIDLDE